MQDMQLLHVINSIQDISAQHQQANDQSGQLNLDHNQLEHRQHQQQPAIHLNAPQNDHLGDIELSTHFSSMQNHVLEMPPKVLNPMDLSLGSHSNIDSYVEPFTTLASNSATIGLVATSNFSPLPLPLSPHNMRRSSIAPEQLYRYGPYHFGKPIRMERRSSLPVMRLKSSHHLGLNFDFPSDTSSIYSNSASGLESSELQGGILGDQIDTNQKVNLWLCQQNSQQPQPLPSPRPSPLPSNSNPPSLSSDLSSTTPIASAGPVVPANSNIVKGDKPQDTDDEELKFVCPHPGCGKVFPRSHNLKSHSLIHSDEKPFKCDKCQAAFRRNHDLRRHYRLHSGIKPYVCPRCNKGFSRSDVLRRHLKVEACSSNALIHQQAHAVALLSSFQQQLQAQAQHPGLIPEQVGQIRNAIQIPSVGSSTGCVIRKQRPTANQHQNGNSSVSIPMNPPVSPLKFDDGIISCYTDDVLMGQDITNGLL